MDEDTENNDMENQDEITKLLADTEAINTIFNEPANLLKDLMDSFGSKSYESTLESGSKVLGIMNEPTEQFIKLGMAFSISAAAQWVSNLGEVGVDITKAEDILSKAKDQFLGGDFPKVNETIGEVRDIIPELEKDQKDAAFEAISQTERLIEEVGKVGAGIDDADGDLQEAKNLLESGKYLEVARLAKKAKESADSARQKRIQTVSDALLFTRSVIDESKGIGVDTSEPEALYKEAKAAFGDGDFQKCSELTKEAEEVALKLQEEHFQKVLELKEKRKSMEVTRAKAAAAEQALAETRKGEEKSEENCLNCSTPMRFVKKYNRYWCKKCKNYAPKK